MIGGRAAEAQRQSQPPGLGGDEREELPPPVGERAAHDRRGRVVQPDFRKERRRIDPQRLRKRGEPGDDAGERVCRIEAKAVHGASMRPLAEGEDKWAGFQRGRV